MSGILLPGQENEPKTEGKIEVPSGYASRESKPAGAPVDQAPEEDSKQATDDAPHESASASERPGQLLFPPRGAQVTCPNCGATYVVPVFSIVDLGANPELRAPLLSGQINVAVCQSCGAGGPLSVPFMVHDPEHEFLGVYTPLEGIGDDLQRQKVIGDLTKMLMAKIPTEGRKGYLLQPQPFVDLERLMERLWEFEGVTPEMLRRQREQSVLLQQLASLADDDSALDLALKRSGDLIDQDFFSMLDQILLIARSQGQNGELDSLQQLREKLLDRTEAGRALRQRQEHVRTLLNQISEKSSRQDVLEIVVDAWQEDDREQLVGALAFATGIATDYEFLMLLTQRIEQTVDQETRKTLEELRSFLLSIQEQLAAQQQQEKASSTQRAQQLFQEVMQELDTEAALRSRVNQIDEAFLALLVQNIRSAEESGATAAARRLTRVYEQALVILQEQMPRDVRLLNQLMTAPDDASARQLLRENRDLLTPDFLANLDAIEEQMRANGHLEVADRLKSVRGQVALML